MSESSQEARRMEGDQPGAPAHPWTASIAVGIVAGIPLAFDPGGYFIFLPIKWTLATVLVVGGVAALIFERRPLPPRPLVAAWAVLLLAFVAASIFGVGGLTSWIGYPGRYLGVLAWVTFFGAFLLGASLLDHRNRARVIRAAAAASILVSLYALLQAVDIDPIEWSEGIDLSRTRSTLGNAAFLGAYLALIVPLAGRLALSSSEPREWRGLHAGAALLAAVALVTTQTRGAWIGALAGLVLVAALEFRKLRAMSARWVAIVGAALLLLLVLATAAPSGTHSGSVRDPSAGTAEGRLILWERTLDLVGGRPVLGWGPDTYAFTFPEFIDSEFERKVSREVVPDRAHNILLDVASATGILGVGAYVVVVGLVALSVARAGERDTATVAIAGACAAYLVQLQFSFPLADLDTVFWLFAGLLVASTASRAGAISGGWGILPRGWAALPVLVALLLAVWGARELAADRLLRRALDTEATGGSSEAQRLVDRAADLVPLRAQYRQAAARLNRRVGEVSGDPNDFARGLEAADDALDVVPRDLELAMDRGDLLLAWGEAVEDPHLIERAAGEYEGILEHDPASSRVHLKLGVAYVELGRGDDAKREWLTAASLSPGSPGPLVNLGVLYQQRGRKEKARRALREALALDPANPSARDLLARLGS